MFTILTADPSCGLPPLFSRGGRLSYVSRGGVRFAVLRLKSASSVNWRKVRRRLGTSAGRVVCGPDITLPEGVAPVDCRRYSQLLAQNGLTELLKPNRPLTCARTAVLIDLNCRHQAFADILVRFFKTVRIVTQRCELYRDYVESRFYECGAVVVIGESLPAEDGASLYVSPDGVLFPAMEETAAPVITAAQPAPPVSARVISDFRAQTPAELDFAPAGIDPHAYQAALFDCCGVGKLAASIPTSAKLGGFTKSMNDLKMFLFSVDNEDRRVYN